MGLRAYSHSTMFFASGMHCADCQGVTRSNLFREGAFAASRVGRPFKETRCVEIGKQVGCALFIQASARQSPAKSMEAHMAGA
jgi:hypothetical protein